MTLNKRKEWLTRRKALILLAAALVIGFVLRVLVITDYPMGPSTFSDDNGYLTASITFANDGLIANEGSPEQNTSIGPGMPLLVGGLAKLFGYDAQGQIAMHIAFSSIGLITAIAAYLLGVLLRDRLTGLLAGVFCALEPGLVALNCVFLTETPYMCLNLFAIYCFLRCAKEWHFRSYWVGVLCLLAGAAFKGLILMAPLAALPIILRKRDSLKKWIPRVIVAALAFVIGFSPWWVRNWKVLDRFVPFTANRGDIQLMGSYMGWGCPEGSYDEMIVQLDAEAWAEGYQEDRAMRFARRGEVGGERLAEWFRTRPVALVLSHLVYKPFVLTTHHMMAVDFVPPSYAQYLWWAALVIALWGVIAPRFGQKAKEGYYMPLFYLMVATFFTGMYAPLARYGISHFPLWLFYTAAGAADLLSRFRRKVR